MSDIQKPVIYGENLIGDYSDDPDNSILLVSHELSLSGAPIVLLNLALALKKAGWQTLIVSPEDGALGPYAAEYGIPAMYYPGLYASDYVAENRKKYAAVIACTIVTAPIVRKLNGTDTPVMWWIHESAAAYGADNMAAMPKRLRGNVHVYCVSAYAKRMLEERFPQYKSELLMYYVKDAMRESSDTKAHFKRSEDGQTVFACVGMVEPRKGQDILLKAIRDIPDQARKNCKFIFVGTVADQEIKKQIESMREMYHQQIVFYEGLGHDEVYEIYNEIDFLICASRDDPMPLVVAEAMSLGRPCICSANTGTAEKIERYESGLTYKNNDPYALARLIEDAYEMSEEKYQVLSANARAAFEKEFSEEVFEENLGEAMEKLGKNVESNLSIVIPCFNEEANIKTIVEAVLASPIDNKEIIIVDDCSTDNTKDVLEREIKPLVSKIIYHEKNQGKGAALRTGFKHATGDVVIIQDADMEYDPTEYPQIVNPIFDGTADVVYGSRFLNGKRKGYLANRLANRTLTLLSNLFTRQKITDMETCYKAFERDIIQSVEIEENRFGFEPEITSKISKMGIKIAEVPISYYPRSMEEGKKIGFKDGLRAIYVICRYR